MGRLWALGLCRGSLVRLPHRRGAGKLRGTWISAMRRWLTVGMATPWDLDPKGGGAGKLRGTWLGAQLAQHQAQPADGGDGHAVDRKPRDLRRGAGACQGLGPSNR